MTANVGEILSQSEKLARDKQPWLPQYQLVSEYVGQRKADFTTTTDQGAFLNSEIWSDIAPLSAETAASALIGLLWPDSYSFELQPFGDLKDDEECKRWFAEATKELQSAMDDPEAGLAMAIDEAMNDFVLYMPAIHVEEGETTDLRFDAWNVSQFNIDEGPDGYIDTFYKTWDYSVKNAVKKFGLANLSKKTQDAFNKKRYLEKIKILHVIEPRTVNPKGGKQASNMPYASIYIEVNEKHLIRESGFNELPTFAFRYSKRIGEKYARTPAMRALPTVMELNALWELITIGAEKTYDPPLGVYDDGTFGGGTIDTSAGAINVINVSGKTVMNRPPIEPLFTVGNIQDIAKLIERLEQTVKDHFMIDRLLDLGNDVAMTAREAIIRQAIRQAALRSVVSRVTAELTNRMIPRCFNILLRKGRFGYAEGTPEYAAALALDPKVKKIPQKIVDMQGKSQRVYTIKYKTPAAREQEAQIAQGILNMYEILGQVSAFDKTVLDLPNNERGLKKLGDIWSVPLEFWNDEDELKAVRKTVSDAQAQQANLAQAAQVAEIAKTAAGARANPVV